MTTEQHKELIKHIDQCYVEQRHMILVSTNEDDITKLQIGELAHVAIAMASLALHDIRFNFFIQLVNKIIKSEEEDIDFKSETSKLEQEFYKRLKNDN